MRISSTTREGIPELWNKMQEFRNQMIESGDLEHVREKQHTVWMWNQIRDNMMQIFTNHASMSTRSKKLEKLVAKGAVTPGYAADILLKEFKQLLKS